MPSRIKCKRRTYVFYLFGRWTYISDHQLIRSYIPRYYLRMHYKRRERQNVLSYNNETKRETALINSNLRLVEVLRPLTKTMSLLK